MVFNMAGGGGGGGSLNFEIVGGPDRPGNPRENTIWVDTNAEITGYEFSVTEPTDPYEGLIWIQTGTASGVAFNAAKKGGVMVYPIVCYQYVDGAFVVKVAESYLFTGTQYEWVDWTQYLIRQGAINVEFKLSGGSLVPGEEYATFSSGGNDGRIAYTQCNVTGHNKLKIELAAGGDSYVATACPAICIGSGVPSVTASTGAVGNIAKNTRFISKFGSIPEGIYELDIGEYSGLMYITMSVAGYNSSARRLYIKNLWLE